MILYLIKRVFSLLVNVVCIVCIVFIVARSLPHDQVLPFMISEVGGEYTPKFTEEYQLLSDKFGYNKPVFYFSIIPRSYPDSFFLTPKYKQKFVKMLIRENGNWQHVHSFLQALKTLPSNSNLNKSISRMYTAKSVDELMELTRNDAHLMALNNSLNNLKYNKNILNNYFLSVRFHGLNNQFHQWIIRVMNFDLGVSVTDGRPVGGKIYEAVRWTVLMNFVAVLLVFIMGIALGVFSDFTRFRPLKSLISNTSYILYAVPVFWLASLLIVFFTKGSPHALLEGFPSVGRLYDCRGTSIISCFMTNIKYLVLPILCLVLPVLAYFTRIMQSSIRKEKNERYVLFLKSQGFSRIHIYFRDILKNAVLPIVTLIGESVPALLSGSLVIEIIFNIPGAGRVIYESILQEDWNVVFIVVMIGALLTTIGYLISDILYRLVDPRIKLS